MEQSLIEQIRRANDIVDVINGYVHLKKTGNSYRGLCPFHNDTHPSLNVSQTKQIYKCFACGKAGNVFTFVQDIEKISFMDAVKKLAQRAGISIPERERTKVVSTKRDLLLRIYGLAKDFFADNLFEFGEIALEYLKKRQISPETAKSLELGYALNSNSALKNHLLKAGVNPALLKESGLFANFNNNQIDLFKDRLMFPIHNHTGEVVAFGGRILSDEPQSDKYINSPSTELYTKGKELYGLFKTKYDIGKADQALVCEGYMDFLRLYEGGITNCAASLGTSLTEDQIYLLGRYTRNIYMLYDGDLAGQKAALRAGLLILSKGFNPRIVVLPEDEDPDSFLLNYGKEALLNCIRQAKTLVSYLAENEKLELTPQEKIEQLADAIRQVRDSVQKEFMIKDAAEAFGISEGAIKQKISLARYNTFPGSQIREEENTVSEEHYLLALALKDKKNYLILAQNLTADYFFIKEYKQIYEYLTAQDRTEEIQEPSRLLDQVEDNALREQLADLLLEELNGMSFENTLKEVIIRKLQHELDEMDKRIKSEPNNLELFQQKSDLLKQLRQITKNRVIHRIIV
ncbi:MAG TPA: DNA primase [Candidatus Cloacimonadota bacterium]|nr:DNA primase [Candidatus Cloacimonadota bacterium]HQL15065.1 DNA primase [Candidatus Cloacimonadota bacterium]